MKADTIGLARRLGNRLRPLAVAIGILISLGLPTTYYTLEFNDRAREARRVAADLAGKLPERDPAAPVREALRATQVARVRLLDGVGRALPGYEQSGAGGEQWWDFYPPRGRADVAPNAWGVAEVEITFSQTNLASMTLALLALSIAVGVGLAVCVYAYPVRIVRGIESRIDDLVTRQESLLGASRVLASTLDLGEVLNRLTEIARSLSGIDVVRIWLRDERTGRMRLHSQSGVERLDVTQELDLPDGPGLIAAVVESGRPVVLRDARGDPRIVNVEWFRAEEIVSYLGVPLKIGDVSLGALVCMSRTLRDWSPTEITLTETLGALAAVAIRNARNFGEMTRRGDRLRSVAELARTVSGSLELEMILQQVIAAVRPIRPDLVCFIRLVDREAGGYRLAASGGVVAADLIQVLPFGQGLTHVVAETRQPLLVEDLASDPRSIPATIAAVGPRVYYGAPIQAGDTLLGTLNVYFPAGLSPTRTEREAIDLFAGQAAIAIHNARLFAESDARRRAAEALTEVGRVLAQALDPEVVGRRIAESISALLSTQTSAVYRLDPESEGLVAVAVSGIAASSLGGVVFPRGVGISGLAVMSRQPAVTADILNDARVVLTPELHARIEAAGYGAVLVVPLIVKDRVIGALGVGDRSGRVFNADEIRVAQAFADQAALAFENARLYQEAMRRGHEAEELARIARSLAESLDVQDLGERIVTNVIPLFAAHSSCLSLREPDGSLRAIAWGGNAGQHFEGDQIIPVGVGVTGRAVAWGAPIKSRDVLADREVILTDDIRARTLAAGDRAILAVPLHAKGELIGVLSVTDSSPRDFTEAEVSLLLTFGDQAALALENARLYQRAQQAYDELSEAQAQLVRGETLRAMGELASGVAHHLNNLLAVVLGRLQLARAKAPPPEIDRHLELSERAALDGAEVVRRMRGFSRGQPVPDLAPVNLNRVAEEVVELTRPRWQDEAQMRGVKIEARVEPGAIPPVPGELSALREVLMNFILNAVDALPRGGTITVRTWASEDGVHCEVADSGVGMSPEVQRRALEPFFTTKGFQSTGLGLSVNYGIIRRHGGELTIESLVDQGTRVVFRLPLVAPSETTRTPRSDAGTSRQPLRILVIDDELEVRKVITEMLAEQGHAVVQAVSGQEGLECLDRDGSFDLVLTDLGMPGMTGWDVARAAKAKRPAVRVGLITGWGEQPAAKPEDHDTADFILAKPITIDGLRAALAHVRSAQA